MRWSTISDLDFPPSLQQNALRSHFISMQEVREFERKIQHEHKTNCRCSLHLHPRYWSVLDCLVVVITDLLDYLSLCFAPLLLRIFFFFSFWLLYKCQTKSSSFFSLLRAPGRTIVDHCFGIHFRLGNTRKPLRSLIICDRWCVCVTLPLATWLFVMLLPPTIHALVHDTHLTPAHSSLSLSDLLLPLHCYACLSLSHSSFVLAVMLVGHFLESSQFSHSIARCHTGIGSSSRTIINIVSQSYLRIPFAFATIRSTTPSELLKCSSIAPQSSLFNHWHRSLSSRWQCRSSHGTFVKRTASITSSDRRRTRRKGRRRTPLPQFSTQYEE